MSKTSIFFILILLVIAFVIWYWNFLRTFLMFIGNIENFDKKYDSLPRATGGRVVISLTTIPSRINNLKATLNSLLDQTVCVDEIAINLPKISRRDGNEMVIPEFLANLKNIKIYLIEEDKGPATKLLPTLKREDKDTRIIYLDDDMVYNKSLIERLANYGNEYPNFAIANRAWNVKDFIVTGNGHHDYGIWDIAMGYAGVVVKPRFFTEEIHNLDSKSAFFADDVWISGFLAKNDVKLFHADMGGYYFRPTGLINALSQRKNHRYHDKVLIDYFWNHWNSI